MFGGKIYRGIKTHFLCSITPPPPENRAVYYIIWGKRCTSGQATDDNIAHAHCMLDTREYKYILGI